MKGRLRNNLFIFLAISAFVFLSCVGNCQNTTTITGTATDTDGIAWAGGQIQGVFIPNSNYPNIGDYKINGVPITSICSINFSGNMDGTGSFSVSNVCNNGVVTPSGSAYSITITPHASAPPQTLPTIPIGGVTQNLTSFITANIRAPRFPAVFTSTLGSYGYADVEIFPTPITGSVYYNVTSGIQRLWTGTAFVDNAGGGGGSGITALTGDGTATGPGSAVLTLAATGVIAGAYGDATHCVNFNVDAKGRILSAVNTSVCPGSGGGSGNMNITLAAGPPSGSCTAGVTWYIDTANNDDWYCQPTNTWRKNLNTTNVGAFFLNGQNEAATTFPPTPGAGTASLYFTNNSVAQTENSSGSVGSTAVIPTTNTPNLVVQSIDNTGTQNKVTPTVDGTTGILNNFNGYIMVGGVTYSTLNAAWTAAVAATVSSGQNQTIFLGPGVFPVTATMAEPTTGGLCVSVVSLNSIETLLAGGTTLNVTTNLGGPVFSLLNSGGTPANGCVFQGLNVNMNLNATSGMIFQYNKGLVVRSDSFVDSTGTALLFGSSSGTDQNNIHIEDVSISYQSGSFQPNARPAFGMDLQATTHDSYFENILIRNALTAGVHISSGSGGNHFIHLHGFGFPYTCTTPPCINNATNRTNANASYATNYVAQDAGANEAYTDTYIDSPAISGFDVQASKINIKGGTAFWLDGVSFPSANVATIESTATFAISISDINTSNLVAPYFTFNSTPTQSAFYGMTGNSQTGVWPTNSALCTDAKGQVISCTTLVTNVTASAPVLSSGGTTPNITCPTCVFSSAALVSNAIILGAGGGQGTQTVAGIVSDAVSQLTLGVVGVSQGAVNLHNSGGTGTLSIQPPATGALSGIVTVPPGTDTLANLAGTQTFSGKTISGSANTLTLLKGSCTVGVIGSGTSNALTSGDDSVVVNWCYNDSGGTRTITAVKCKSDAASNTTTVAPAFGTNGTGTAILSGALTCGSSNVMSSSGTISNAAWTGGTGLSVGMGGTLTGTNIAMIVDYTYTN